MWGTDFLSLAKFFALLFFLVSMFFVFFLQDRPLDSARGSLSFGYCILVFEESCTDSRNLHIPIKGNRCGEKSFLERSNVKAFGNIDRPGETHGVGKVYKLQMLRFRPFSYVSQGF